MIKNKISVLVVEDDKSITNAYKYKFEEAGFKVMVANNGDEALRLIKKNIPDVILLDILMPVKDGFETLIALKQNKKWQKIPVIVASNLGEEKDIAKAFKLGADEYIVKSKLSLGDLVEKIKATFTKNSYYED